MINAVSLDYLQLRCMVNFCLHISFTRGKPCKVFQGLNFLKGSALVLMKKIFLNDTSQ